MKKFVIILLSVIFVLFACQQKPTEDEKKISEEITSTFDSSSLATTKIDSDENQSFFFKYKFKPGDTFRYRLTVISQNEQHFEADSVVNGLLEQKQIYIIDFKTLSLDEDSITELQCTFSSVNIDAKVNAQEISYKSGTAKDSAERSKFAEYEAFLNNPFNIRVSKYGEVKDIYKLDKIMDQFLILRNMIDSIKADEKAGFKENLSFRTIKPLLAQMIREVPEHKMTIDSTWSYKRESLPVMVFQVRYKNLYRVAGIEKFGDDKIAVIDGIVESSVEGNQKYSERGIDYVFDKPVSTASGKIYFNLDKGLIQKSRTQTKLTTSYKMEMKTPQGNKKGSARETSTTTNILELLKSNNY